jgi:CubicO group peptidase (beta-lactamase class C family)
MLLLLMLALSLGTLQGFAQDKFKHEQKIVSLVEPYLANNKVNSVSIGVIANGQTWKRSFGSLSTDDTRSADEKTIYEIGSISKVFTSILLADAIESGKLKLDDPISTVMKDLAKKNPTIGSTITFRHLSHHMSGLPPMPTNIAPADPTNPFKGYDRAMLTEYMLSAAPAKKPNEAYEYSNLAAGLLGDLLSQQAGVSYEALLKEKITGPLGMKDTTITLSKDQSARLAPPRNSALLPDKAWDFDALAGCGAIRSNVDDMLLFAQASMNPPDGPVGKALDLAWKQHKPAIKGNHAMGLGWMIAGDGSTRWHNGQTGGYHGMILVSRDLKCATVMLCNTAELQLDALAEQIFQTLAGLDVKPKTFEKELKVDPKVAKRLEGKYQLAPGFVLTVQVKEGRMMAQLTGQQFLGLSPKSETEWKYQAVDATLKFELPESGNSPKLTLLQNGREMPCSRIAE